MAKQKQDDQLEPAYSSSVRIRDVALRTSQKRWTIEKSGERGSGISVLAARQADDDDDDDDITWSKQFKPTVVRSIEVVGAFLHYACDLKAAEMNKQCRLIRELMIYKFKMGPNTMEVTKNMLKVKTQLIDRRNQYGSRNFTRQIGNSQVLLKP